MASRLSRASFSAWIDAQYRPKPKPQSFFDLPREAREAIYRCLFVPRLREVLIVDALEQELLPAWLGRNAYMLEEEDYHVEHLRGEAFHASATNLPVAFLQTCHQIYDEAATVLYGENTFIVSVARHRHNPALRQLRTIVRWIESMGSHYKLLKKVLIDMGPTCGYDCEFQPFTKLIWARPELKGRILFYGSKRKVEPLLHDGYPMFDDDYDEHERRANDAASAIEYLNKICRSLTVDDSLNLQRYAKFDRLISSIPFKFDFSVYWGLSNGLVVFPSTRPFRYTLTGLRKPDDIIRSVENFRNVRIQLRRS
ncbi:hypothetical protein NX059_009445 [Plenodomus lindquistii]|nr:hypothetical protein NX059_009445 [Plenodomus lindquistii]